MPDLVRQEVATAAHTVVVKVGTRVLTGEDGCLNEARIVRLAAELAELADAGCQVALVSSGAVGAGLAQLGIDQRPRDVAQLQAIAAVGQSHLIETYDRALRGHNRHAAQLLLTTDDLTDRTRYLNVRNTLRALFEHGAVPIINENDTVSVEELRTTFGDNDHLAAMVTNLIHAPLLVLLSDVDGLYDGDPADAKSKVLPTVDRIDRSIRSLVCDRQTGMSKGGMSSKLDAAQIATAAGENVIIASGRRPGVLAEIFQGERVGTLILPSGQTVASRKRWIGFAAQTRGQLVLDQGAQRAIQEQGRSLLAIGIVGVEGNFKKGDVVSLRGTGGEEVARGLTNYHADEIRKIGGLRTDQITKVLGCCPYDEIVHRDNLMTTCSPR